MSGDYDWDDEDTILHRQPRTAVYWNGRQQVVIRQENDDPFDEDAYVFFSVENLAALIEALQIRLIESGLGDPVLDQPQQRRHATPGALRSKRYRERCAARTVRHAETVTGDISQELFPRAAE